jgi:hypothetical protein
LTSERGQSTAFVSALLLVLVLFVGVVADVGQSVNRRIALQIIADAGAYTGASSMATGLNQMAYWNDKMQWLWAGFTTAMIGAFKGRVTECYSADIAEIAYYGSYAAVWTAYQAASRAYANIPYMEARSVSEFNASHLFPGEELTYGEWSLSPEVNAWTLRLPPFNRDLLSVMTTKQVDDGTELSSVPWWARFLASDAKSTLRYGCISYGRLEVRNRWYPVWYEKAEDEVKSFVWIVAAPARRAAMFDGLFRRLGVEPMPPMRAMAVAKPVGGTIVDGEAEYVAKMTPAGRAMVTAGLIYDGRYDRYVRLVTH